MAIKRDIVVTFKTNDGKDMPITFSVYDGKSAFEVWQDQPGNEKKTEADFFKAITGARGDGIASVSISVTEIP